MQGSVLFNDALNTPLSRCKEVFYLTMHSTHRYLDAHDRWVWMISIIHPEDLKSVFNN